MYRKTLTIGTDHRGYALKEFLIKQSVIADYEIAWLDVGAYSDERTDYPLFAQKAVADMKGLGILLCGNGTGMAIAANRHKGIYAGVAWNEAVARQMHEDDNVNVLVLPADYLKEDEALRIVASWLCATFKQGRYAQRLAMIDALR